MTTRVERLLAHAESVGRTALRVAGAKPVVIKIGAWGRPYVEAMLENGLACIEANDMTGLTVIVDIHVPEASMSRVRTSSVYAELKKKALIWLKEIPPDVFAADAKPHEHREVQALIEYQSLMAARAIGAHWMPMQGDTLISNRYIKSVASLLEQGWRAVAGAPLRMEKETFCTAHPGLRDVSAVNLYRASLHFLHRVTADYFLTEPSREIPADPHQVFFTTPTGMSVCSPQLFPFGINTKFIPEDHPFDMMTADCRLLSDVMIGADFDRDLYVKRNLAADDFYFTSLDTLDGITSFGKFPVTVDGVVAMAKKFGHKPHDREYFSWAARQRIVYGKPAWSLPDNCVDELLAVRAISDGIMAPAELTV